MTMEPEPGKSLDDNLDRLMETAYKALAGEHGRPRRRVARVPTFIGPYPVSGLLGQGGTSVVFRARDPELGRDLAIKVLDEPDLANEPLAARFLHEARVCSQLAHPGIVPIYSSGTLDDGRPYFTMQLVEGETLGALLAGRAHPADRRQQFLEVFARVCETVAFAHSSGVVHGDLKPANIMVGSFGQVQVMDWGFARLVANGRGSSDQRVMGTPAFMAPEQAIAGRLVDARTDVFGLGGILCVILTGAPPFVGSSRSELQVRTAQGCLDEAVERLQNCGVDSDLVRLAVDCLAPLPKARPADAAAVAIRVAEWMTSIKERAHRLELEAAQARVKAAEQRRTRNRSVAIALLVLSFGGIYARMKFERQAHDYETRMAVVQAIERARNLRDGADFAGHERIHWLGEASLAAQHAQAFAATVEDAALQGEAGLLSARLTADHDAAVRDERMERWFDEFQSHLELTRDELDRNAADGFRAYGVDVEQLPIETVVARLRESTIAPSLARALDDWGFVRHADPGVAPASWRRFHEIGMQVDDDPARTAVRRALLDGDAEALVDLARALESGDAGTETLDLLANCLTQLGRRSAAIGVWQRANARHPDSVRVIHSLAVNLLVDGICPPWDEMVRLFTSATAVRPDSAHLWTDLGYALVGQGDVAGAEAALRRALEVRPADQRALASLIDLLRGQGRNAEMLAECKRFADRAPADADALRYYGDVSMAEGNLSQAVVAYRHAVELMDTPTQRERLGTCLLELGDAAGAAAVLQSAVDGPRPSAAAAARLGVALSREGRFEEASAALKRGSAMRDAVWSAHCDAMHAAVDEVAAAARASAGPSAASTADTIVDALGAQLAGRPGLAAERYRIVFAREPLEGKGPLFGRVLDWAVQAAWRAATGEHCLEPELDAAQREAWRQQAFVWLRTGVAAVQGGVRAGTVTPAEARRQIDAWRNGPLRGVVASGAARELAELERQLGAGEPSVQLQLPFATTCKFRWIGRPTGMLSPFGGLTFDDCDPDRLLVVGHAQRETASLCAVNVHRDDLGHIVGFTGTARHLAAVPFADGGIERGAKGMWLYTRYPGAQIGQIEPGARVPYRIDSLGGPSSGGFGFVPVGLPGAGRAKRLAWPGGEWIDVTMARDGAAMMPMDRGQTATLMGGPDGFVYLPGGVPPFTSPTLLVAEWSSHSIAAYELDADGDPVVETRRVVVTGCRGVLGLAVDRCTGDVLASTWRRDGTEQIGLLVRTGP